MKLAHGYVSRFVGGTALALTLVALTLASVFTHGLTIRGFAVLGFAATVVVWLVTRFVAISLPGLFVRDEAGLSRP